MEQIKRDCKCKLLGYLTKSGYLDVIERLVKSFGERLERGEADALETFYCPVEIDVVVLTDVYSSLCVLMQDEPYVFQRAVEELVHTALMSHVGSDVDEIQLTQIVAPVVLVYLPRVLDERPRLGLMAVHGVVVEHTAPTKYIRTSRWECPNDRNPTVFRGLPSPPPLCSGCAGALEEIPKARNEGRTVSLRVVNIEMFRRLDAARTEWPTLCHVDDDRDCGVTVALGNEVYLAGTVRNDTLEAWCLQTIGTGIVDYRSRYRKVEALRMKLQASPWEFVKRLSDVIGAEFYAPGMHAHLRMGLLLSLASAYAAPIPVLAIGEDTLSAEHMMRSTLPIAQRHFHPFLPADLGGHVRGEWRCAGALQLAANGICYLGDWDSYADSKGQPVRDAVETGVVVLKDGGGESVPLTAAVWTYWDMPRQYKSKRDKQWKTLLKIFGFAWNSDIEPHLDIAEVECIIGMTPPPPPEVPVEELRVYLSAINNASVELGVEAKELLRRYFACTRHARGDVLPLKSLDTLTSITEAHARLNQRPVALAEDALLALSLCETALGPCAFYPPPPEDMSAFGVWLRLHLLNLVPDN